jgi:hypothetical protein
VDPVHEVEPALDVLPLAQLVQEALVLLLLLLMMMMMIIEGRFQKKYFCFHN